MLHGLFLLPFTNSLSNTNLTINNLYEKYQKSPIIIGQTSKLNLANSRLTHSFSPVLLKDINAKLSVNKSFFGYLNAQLLLEDKSYSNQAFINYKKLSLSEDSDFMECTFDIQSYLKVNLIDVSRDCNFTRCDFLQVGINNSRAKIISIDSSGKIIIDRCSIKGIASVSSVESPFISAKKNYFNSLIVKYTNFTNSSFTGNAFQLKLTENLEFKDNVFDGFGIINTFMSLSYTNGIHIFSNNIIISDVASNNFDLDITNDNGSPNITFEYLCIAYKDKNEQGYHFNFADFENTELRLINCCFSREKSNWFKKSEGIIKNFDLVTNSDKCLLIHPFKALEIPLIAEKKVVFIREKS